MLIVPWSVQEGYNMRVEFVTGDSLQLVYVQVNLSKSPERSFEAMLATTVCYSLADYSRRYSPADFDSKWLECVNIVIYDLGRDGVW